MMPRHRALRPAAEGLEARDLPSAIQTVLAAAQAPAPGPSNDFTDPTGNPTSHEMKRQRVRFMFEGRFLQGPPRFDDTRSQILIKGVGSSTLFLHGDLQLGAYVPKDASRPVSGVAVSFDRNINANSTFGINLEGSTARLDRAGRPTRLTFTMNSDLSSGTFGQSEGGGVVTIRYIPGARSTPGALTEGRAIVSIRGDVYTLGVNNIFGVLGTTNTLNPRRVRI